ncbi:unnamed protein product [Alternaria alternata]
MVLQDPLSGQRKGQEYVSQNHTSLAVSSTVQGTTAKHRDVAVSAPNSSIADGLAAGASKAQDSDTHSPMDATEKAIEDLAAAIEEAPCANSKDELFLPVDKIRGFVEEEKIRDVVGHTQSFDQMEDLVRFVQEHAQRLFLILIMMESQALELELKYFQDMGFDDRVLPIWIDHQNRSAYNLRDPHSSAKRYRFPRKWGRGGVVLFEEFQRRFTVPVFGTPNTFHHHMPEGQRLPYLEVAPKPASSGYFGEVSRNIIHAKHIHPSIELPIMVWTSKNPIGGTQTIQIDAIAVAVKKTKEGDDDPNYSRAEFFDKEVGNLKRLREYNSPHLIKPISGYQIGQDRCLMFPWAEGGNLGGYWKDFPMQARNQSHVLWQLRQFVGICSALTELHNRNVRHGDLKPENILWFDPQNNGGTLQIADLGLATFHKKEADTRNRQGMPTQTPSGTSRYEPPEMDEKRNSQDPRSRQYDIWSLGCIAFELLLWLAYGPSDITIFRDNTPYFWQKHHRRGQNEYVVHEYVVAIMDTLDRNLEPGTAYKDLLDLVRNRLLVIKYSANYDDVPEDCRESATKVHGYFMITVQKCESNQGYLKPLTEKLSYPEAELEGKATHRNDFQRNEVHEKDVPMRSVNDQDSDPQTKKPSKLNDDWTSSPDNDFATRYFDVIGWQRVRPTLNMTLSNSCGHRFSSEANSLFEGVCDLAALQESAKTCDLCSLLQDALAQKGLRPPSVVDLRSDAAHVGLKDGPNLLSLYCEPGRDVQIPEGAQLGLIQLFSPKTSDFFALLKEWIRVCDLDHNLCQHDDEALTMPTRLIEVGDHIRLVETATIKPCRYVALSHCWGPLQKHQRFCTYKQNITQRKAGIAFDALPRTFRDAVTVTQGLSVRYIWIDSLCIIQDDENDWQSEASKMEQVFSAAYCTIGASAAKSSLQGFLTERIPRSVVKVPVDVSKAMYACLSIDDFHNDVELSPLNSRGWVLQERALSRRTIFFTSTQVYWECGAGIHCETLAVLKNPKATALLGDANFPTFAVSHYKDGRQLLIQDLYERYSSLAFTMPADRSIAILGLQKRLSRAFNTRAAHGLFDAYFARGLLWKRRYWQRMEHIAQPPGRQVPSWSSLSKHGSIQYMDATNELRFEKVSWATDDFQNPFATRKEVVDDNEIVAFRG